MPKDSSGSGHRRAERWRWAGEAGLLTRLPPSGIGRIADATPIDHARGPSRPWRVDLSEGGSLESALRPMGSCGEPASPDSQIGGASDGAPRGALETRGIIGGDSPPPSRTIGGTKPPIDGYRRMAGGGGIWNSGPPTRISKQLIGRNADELKKKTGEGREELGE